MSKPAPIHICFYSTRCQWSKVFIEEISKTEYHKDFRFVCVDPGQNRPQLPSWLKQTPTLVIRGEQEPRTNSEVMNWLYEQRMRDGGKTNNPNLRLENHFSSNGCEWTKLYKPLKDKDNFNNLSFLTVKIWVLSVKSLFLQFLVDILPRGSGFRKPKSCRSKGSESGS